MPNCSLHLLWSLSNILRSNGLYRSPGLPTYITATSHGQLHDKNRRNRSIVVLWTWRCPLLYGGSFASWFSLRAELNTDIRLQGLTLVTGLSINILCHTVWWKCSSCFSRQCCGVHVMGAYAHSQSERVWETKGLMLGRHRAAELVRTFCNVSRTRTAPLNVGTSAGCLCELVETLQRTSWFLCHAWDSLVLQQVRRGIEAFYVEVSGPRVVLE